MIIYPLCHSMKIKIWMKCVFLWYRLARMLRPKGMLMMSCLHRLKSRETSTKSIVCSSPMSTSVSLCSSEVNDVIWVLCLCWFSVSKALNSAEHALLGEDEDKLYDALRTPALGLQSVQAQNKGWYLKQLLADRDQKEQVTGSSPRNGLPLIVWSTFVFLSTRFVFV